MTSCSGEIITVSPCLSWSRNGIFAWFSPASGVEMYFSTNYGNVNRVHFCDTVITVIL
uniref:Uncharacterized protein n=1 Tax=Anguilla anguilla TaxID=7936 RepID=A0A0E9PW63_ANGAN